MAYHVQQLPLQTLQLPTDTHEQGGSVQFDDNDPWLACPYVDSESEDVNVSVVCIIFSELAASKWVDQRHEKTYPVTII